MRVRLFAIALSMLTFIQPAFAQAGLSQVLGDWRTQGGWATVRIAPCASDTNRMCGTIVALRRASNADGQPLRDAENPNPSLRSRPLVGLPFLSGFRAARNGRWVGGHIYDPDSGRTYDSNMHVRGDGALEVNGCVLFICRAQIWTRAIS